jgi:hypothetical protein
MADPTPATSGVAGLLAGPMGPWIAIALAPAVAAGWGADQAVERAGGGKAAIVETITEQIRPIRAEQEAGAAERKRHGEALEDLRRELRSLTRAIVARQVAPIAPGRAAIPADESEDP